MTHPFLKTVIPSPEAWAYACPHCEHQYDGLWMAENDFGAFEVDGPDRFPLCDECGEQFEIVAVKISEMDQ